MSSKRKSRKGKPKSNHGAGGGRKGAARNGANPISTPPAAAQTAASQAPGQKTPRPEAPAPEPAGQARSKAAPGTAQYRRPEPASRGEDDGAPSAGKTGGLPWPMTLGLILLGAGALFVYAQLHTSPCAPGQQAGQEAGKEPGKDGAARECAHSWFSWSRGQTASNP